MPTGPSEPVALIERDEEILEVERVIAEGGMLVVLGGGGVGKSSLLDLAEECAGRSGARVLRARGVELERDVPFGVIRALLGPHADVSAPINRLLLFVEELAAAAPLVLLVDDAHDADDFSLRAIAFLGRRLAGLPIALVVAGRPFRRAAVGMLELEAVEGATVIRPQALSMTGTATLVRRRHADAAAEFVVACHEVTRGNPLFLRELLVVVGEEGLAPDAAASERVRAVGPASVSRAVMLVLRRLPQEATDVVRSMAILEGDEDWGLIARLAHVGLDQALHAGTLLSEAGVLDASDPPVFVHPIVRAAVLADLLPTERALVHRRAAALLDEAGAPVERIAGHLLQAPPGADARMCAVLRGAARTRVARGAPDSATRLLRRALAEPPPAAERPGVLRELARSAAAAGAPDAVELLAKVEAQATNPRDRAQAALEHGSALYADGRFADACVVFDAARQQLGGDDGELNRELQAAWAGAALWMGVPYGEIRGLLLNELAQPDAGGTWRRSPLLAAAGAVEMMRAENDGRAIGLTLLAWNEGRMLDDLDLGDPALWSVAATLLHSGELDAVEEVLKRVLDAAGVAGAFDVHATASCMLGHLYERRGDLPAAEAAVGIALDAHADGWNTFLPAALWLQARCRLERGDVEGAAATLAIPAADEQHWEGSPVLMALHAARGAVALAQGKPAEALVHFAAQGRCLSEMGSCNPAFYGWHAGAALACDQLGRRDEAVAHAEEDLAIARRYGVESTIGAALRVRAGLYRAKDAIAPLTEAVSLLAGSSERLQHARALVDLGVALRAADRRLAAREPLRAGFDLATACDATALCARARAELVAAGGRPRRAELSGLPSLTPSERRVADLAVSGLTNRGIAEALFVTRKAVEFHLANVYRKLNIRRREELAAVWALA